MKKGKAADALVLPLLSTAETTTSNGRRATVDHLAVLFRDHLTVAGVKRAELHASTATHVQANFRSWRDSGLTWLAMSGLGVDKIMRRAGHDIVQTTMGYVKLAEDLTGELGEPFAALPASLGGAITDLGRARRFARGRQRRHARILGSRRASHWHTRHARRRRAFR